jgi:hypothetical protein
MFICKFCNKEYTQNAGGMVHQNQCILNPNRVQYQLGRKAWNTGLTADIDPRLKKMAETLSSSMKGRIACNKNLDRSSLNLYRSDCGFKFSVYDYPEEFDLYLIEELGWYKPKNRGNNLTGVSRDHMVSVKYGWKNNISPEIISHPANCKLLKHSDNVSKYDKNSLTIDELYIRINNWNIKYMGF